MTAAWSLRRRHPIRVRLTGELDIASVPAFARVEAAVGASPGRRVIIDLSDVTFLDAAALRVFVNARATAEQRGGSFGVLGVRAHLLRIFEMTDLEDLLVVDGGDVAGAGPRPLDRRAR